MYSLSRRALVEFIGTLALIFIGAGSILSDRLDCTEECVRLEAHCGHFLKLLEEKSLLPFRDGFDGAFAAKFVRL